MKNKARLLVVIGIILVSVTLIGVSVFAVKNTIEKHQKSAEDPADPSVSEAVIPETEDGANLSHSSTSSEATTDAVPATSASSESEDTSSTAESSIPSETTVPSSGEIPVNKGSHGTMQGDGVEGVEGTGKYNYGEALQKSVLFYELQRSGDLPEDTRCNWRGDSCLKDGSDAGVDLTGGWFDAGDNVKFNLPMAYSASVLGWSIYEDRDAYEQSGQLSYALANIRWANEYFIKCHPSPEKYFYQVGNGSADHGWWGAAECVEYRMDRPSYFVDAQHPGSAVTGETAASLAICSMLFKTEDPAFSEECLQHAMALYAFADKYKSDAGYTAANGFYDSWSGYYDELSWAAVWLYRATGDANYLSKAKEYYPKANQDFNWAFCWDDVHIGAAVLLAQETGEQTYTSAVEKHLDFWSCGTASGERITYTPKGLAWLDSWGSLRYATTTSFVAAVYSESEVCTASKKEVYWDFAVSQANYALGDTGFSYQIGFGDSYPVNPHHRTAQGSYCDNMNEPGTSRHILVGALVGGPDASDGYTDVVSDYCANEVACDYNAGFTGLMAKLYTRYHGQTLTGFGACEAVGEEYRVETSVNASGADFLEIKALTYNMTGWPARAPKNLELRYYFTVPSGKKASDLSVSSSYGQDVASLTILDASGDTACVQVLLAEYSCYPGGQSQYKKEVQFRITGLPSDAAATGSACLFENGVLVFGQVPGGPGVEVITTPTPGASQGGSQGGNAPSQGGNQGGAGNSGANGKVSVSIEYTMSGSGNAIAGNMTIENVGQEAIDLGGLTIDYYFTNEKDGALTFDCYHSAVSAKNGQYSAIESVAGAFAKAEKKNGADTVCTMSGFGSGKLSAGDKLIVQFSIHHNDWSDFNLGDDYSRQKVENIVIRSAKNKLFGEEPS